MGTDGEIRDFVPLLKWLLVNCLALFGIVMLFYFGLIQSMLATDPTHISLVIVGLFAVMLLNCLYHTVWVSRELVVARKVKETIEAEGGGANLSLVNGVVTRKNGQALEAGVLTNYIRNLFAKAHLMRSHGSVRGFDQTVLLRSLADGLKGREKLGLFVSEALLRVALLGTAIGFILMLIPISGLTTFEADTLRTTLSGMTGGMAIALNVTVTGLAAALLLKFEFFLLDQALADLFRVITEVTEVEVLPALDRPNV
jgi:hypothetical protein